MESQHKRILDFIEKKGEASNLEMEKELHITHPSARMSEIRKAGIKVHDRWETGVDQFGRPVRYKIYFLKEEVTV